MTVLHGFPSSSHDWARAAPQLATGHALLLPDFLGFGASDNPADHDYSLTGQADVPRPQNGPALSAAWQSSVARPCPCDSGRNL